MGNTYFLECSKIQAEGMGNMCIKGTVLWVKFGQNYFLPPSKLITAGTPKATCEMSIVVLARKARYIRPCYHPCHKDRGPRPSCEERKKGREERRKEGRKTRKSGKKGLKERRRKETCHVYYQGRINFIVLWKCHCTE